MAEVEASMVALTGEANGRLAQAVKSLLRDTEDGTVDPKAVREVLNRVRLMPSVADGAAAQKAAIQNLTKIERFNSRDIQRSIGIAVPEYSSAIGEQWRREHVAKIKSLGETPKARMVELLRESSQKQTRVETLKKQIENEFGVNSRRARLIARDQILTLNAKLTEDRHKRAGITEYKWRVIDGAARSNHKDLDGKTFSYDDPPMGGGTGPDDKGNPGTGIGCRCQAIPVIPSAVKKQAEVEADPKAKSPPGKPKAKPEPAVLAPALVPVAKTKATKAKSESKKAAGLKKALQAAEAAASKLEASKAKLAEAKERLAEAKAKAKVTAPAGPKAQESAAPRSIAEVGHSKTNVDRIIQIDNGSDSQSRDWSGKVLPKEHFEKLSRKTAEVLTDAERRVVHDYTGKTGFIVIRKSEWDKTTGRLVPLKDRPPRAQVIDRAIEKAINAGVPQKDLEAWRGIQNMPLADAEKILKKGTFDHRGTASASREVSTASYFGDITIDRGRDGDGDNLELITNKEPPAGKVSVLYRMRTQTAVPIETISESRSEHEVLIRAGTEFRVTKSYWGGEDKSVLIIEGDEVQL